MRHTPYTKLTRNQLHNILTKRKLPDETIVQIKEDIALKKKAINKNRVETRVRVRRWNDLIRPLTHHIGVIKINNKYHAEHNPELHAFYLDYLDTLIDTRHHLTSLKLRRTETPIAYAKKHGKDLKDWTDWVNEIEKKDLTHRYLSIPYPSKFTHRRELFPRPKKTTQTT
jgi:thioesterase domain-containing protein